MSFMPPTDSMFLLAESREHPMHVGGLQLYVPPDDAGPDYVRELVETYTNADIPVNKTFLKRPAEPVGLLGQTWWSYDDQLDFEHHVRHSAVPTPGRVRELLAMTSRWHGALLDRHRPLWEVHVIEGLKDGRIAIYAKIHHAMVDGVSALRLMQKSLSPDPNDMTCLPPWFHPERKPRTSVPGSEIVRRVPDPFGLFRKAAGTVGDLAGDVAGLVPASMKVVNQTLKDGDLTLPRAPRTILNGPVGGARRFAAQSWEIERIQGVAKSSATTMNDVVLAMVGGALRQYLIEQNALPDESLTAMVPVSLSLRAGETESSGNAVGAIVVNLATNRDDASTRLEEVAYSARQAKKFMSGLSQTQILAFSAVTMLPLAFGPVPGVVKHTRPPFNVVVSNVPGPKDPMFFNGARLDGLYPASIVLDGQAVNFTLTSRHGYIDFGIIGCRKTVPHLQRLLLHLENELTELEKNWG